MYKYIYTYIYIYIYIYIYWYWYWRKPHELAGRWHWGCAVERKVCNCTGWREPLPQTSLTPRTPGRKTYLSHCDAPTLRRSHLAHRWMDVSRR